MRFGWKKKKSTTMPLGTVPRRRTSDEAAGTNGPIRDDSYSTITFRRNQTITGSSSSSVNAVTSHEAQLRSARQEAHQLRHKRRSLLSLAIVILAAAGVLFVMLYQSVLSVDVALYGQIGALNQSQEAGLRKVIDQYYGGNPFQRIRAFFSPSQLASYMQMHGHPEVDSILSLDPKALGVAVITLKVREPIASWTIGGVEHFVDNRGIVFNENYYAAPPIAIVDQSNIAPAQGEIASSRLLQFIGIASAKLKANKYTIHQVILPANTTREVEFVLSTGPALKMTIDRSAGEQCEDAVRALQYFAAHGITISYADVRVSRQAYYQ